MEPIPPISIICSIVIYDEQQRTISRVTEAGLWPLWPKEQPYDFSRRTVLQLLWERWAYSVMGLAWLSWVAYHQNREMTSPSGSRANSWAAARRQAQKRSGNQYEASTVEWDKVDSLWAQTKPTSPCCPANPSNPADQAMWTLFHLACQLYAECSCSSSPLDWS